MVFMGGQGVEAGQGPVLARGRPGTA